MSRKPPRNTLIRLGQILDNGGISRNHFLGYLPGIRFHISIAGLAGAPIKYAAQDLASK